MSATISSLPRVAILLSTYNGQDYLAAQLDSLFAQDYEDFIVVVRDDGSQDGTLGLLRNYAQAEPKRLRILDPDDQNLGPCASFSTLISYVLAQKSRLGLEQAYMMFCDQDDLWYPHKVRASVQAMLALETEHPHRACLVHSDLRVVDATGEVIATSFFDYQGIRAQKHSFARMLVSNSVTGCSALINEKLAHLATPIPDQAIMHDWWLALVAASVGHVRPLEEVLLDYRQHGRNTLGAKQHQATEFSLQKLRKLRDPAYDVLSAKLATQAACFAGRHYANLKNRDVFLLSVILWMKSRHRYLRNGVLFSFIALFT